MFIENYYPVYRKFKSFCPSRDQSAKVILQLISTISIKKHFHTNNVHCHVIAANVKLLPYDLEITGSNRWNSLLQTKIRLCTINHSPEPHTGESFVH